VSVELSSAASHDVSGIQVTFEHVDVGAAVVAGSAPDIALATVASASDYSGHSFGITRTLTVPAGAVAGDLIVVAGAAMSWDSAPGQPAIEPMTSTLTFTQIADNHQLASRSAASAWVKVVEAGDAGQDVSVTFVIGSAYSIADGLWMFHVPSGAITAYTANEFASLVGGVTETISPAVPVGGTHVGLVISDRYPGGDISPAINAPAGANWHLANEANRARAALTSIPAAGLATWESTGGTNTSDPLHLRAWRIGIS